jgi:hypothetical protein
MAVLTTMDGCEGEQVRYGRVEAYRALDHLRDKVRICRERAISDFDGLWLQLKLSTLIAGHQLLERDGVLASTAVRLRLPPRTKLELFATILPPNSAARAVTDRDEAGRLSKIL